jgi:hypothetical protein
MMLGFSLFQLFWQCFCKSLSGIIQSVCDVDKGQRVPDVAGLYSLVQVAALDMLHLLLDSIPAGVTSYDESSTAPNSGILGGSSFLCDPFLGWMTGQNHVEEDVENPQSADSWMWSSSTPIVFPTLCYASTGSNQMMTVLPFPRV